MRGIDGRGKDENGKGLKKKIFVQDVGLRRELYSYFLPEPPQYSKNILNLLNSLPDFEDRCCAAWAKAAGFNFDLTRAAIPQNITVGMGVWYERVRGRLRRHKIRSNAKL